MADTDEASIAYAREAEQTKGLARADAAALAPILGRLAHADEVKFLDNFATSSRNTKSSIGLSLSWRSRTRT